MPTLGSSLAAYKSTSEERSVSNSNTLDIKYYTEPTSVLEKNEAYGTLKEVPAKEFDYAENYLEDSRRLSISPNPAYSEVSSRPEGDIYYIPEGMDNAAEVRVTKNEAHATNTTPSKDRSLSSCPSGLSLQNPVYEEVFTRAESDQDYSFPDIGTEEVKMSRNKAYAANPDIASTSIIPKSMNPWPAYGGVSSRTETEQKYFIDEGTQEPEEQKAYDANTGSSQGSLLSENAAYGEVPIRVEDDQDYYVNEGMGRAAEVRMTKNEAYGTCGQ